MKNRLETEAVFQTVKESKTQIKDRSFKGFPFEGKLSPQATDEVEKRRVLPQNKYYVHLKHLIRFAPRTTLAIGISAR